MKQKRGTYFLLAIVCLIWLGIAVQIYNAVSPKSNLNITPNKLSKNNTILKLEKESFQIQLVTRDPFLGSLKKKKAPKKRSKNIKPSKKIQWPRIIYNGIVTDKNKNSAVFLIQINGVMQLMKKGETIHELTLVAGDKTAVTLLYQKEKQEFKIKN